MKTPAIKFEELPVGSVFTNPRNGWTYRKLPNTWKGAGRAEFVKTDIAAAHLVGKGCVYARTSRVIPKPVEDKNRFHDWTDAQLNMTPPHLFGKHLAEAEAEISRRKSAGTWLKDGSTERVAKLIADNSPNSAARKDARRRSHNNPD